MTSNFKEILSEIDSLRADFDWLDFILALQNLNYETMGRYSLQDELALSESSTKSLLRFAKEKQMVKSKKGRSGHSLTTKGKEFTNLLRKFIIEDGQFQPDIFKNLEHYYTILKHKQDNLISWKIRDSAIKHGAEAILVLEGSSNNTLQFPEKEMKLKDHFHFLVNSSENLFKSKIEEDLVVLIIGAKDKQTARKSALATSILTTSLSQLLL